MRTVMKTARTEIDAVIEKLTTKFLGVPKTLIQQCRMGRLTKLLQEENESVARVREHLFLEKEVVWYSSTMSIIIKPVKDIKGNYTEGSEISKVTEGTRKRQQLSVLKKSIAATTSR
ncbi:hypothetical protein KQX54_015799 [Cotesia glomerata]|uniref:Uncharacterized protein n=1 Tax=Cotesia glomerata TaxID=32391 RepID=A0AAV7J759_COTGL|nr:hypothetical protein KQX54_015799 [Cotesia glomerata]